jgi:hypothetical protein
MEWTLGGLLDRVDALRAGGGGGGKCLRWGAPAEETGVSTALISAAMLGVGRGENSGSSEGLRSLPLGVGLLKLRDDGDMKELEGRE